MQQVDHQVGARGGTPIAVCGCVVTAGAYSELAPTCMWAVFPLENFFK